MAIATLSWMSSMTTHCPFSLDNGSACLVIGERVGCIRWSFIGRQGDKMVVRARTRAIPHGSGPDHCFADHLRLGICNSVFVTGRVRPVPVLTDGADVEMLVRDIREMVVDVVDIRMDEA